MIDPRPATGDFAPAEKEQPPLAVSKSWACDWDVWLARQVKKLIEKVRK